MTLQNDTHLIYHLCTDTFENMKFFFYSRLEKTEKNVNLLCKLWNEKTKRNLRDTFKFIEKQLLENQICYLSKVMKCEIMQLFLFVRNTVQMNKKMLNKLATAFALNDLQDSMKH